MRKLIKLDHKDFESPKLYFGKHAVQTSDIARGGTRGAAEPLKFWDLSGKETLLSTPPDLKTTTLILHYACHHKLPLIMNSC